MRLLIGIHLTKIHEQKAFAKFVKQNFKKDPHTFLVSFYSPCFQKECMDKLVKDAGIAHERVFSLQAAAPYNNLVWDTSFTPYKESFEKAIETALQNAWAREKVDVILFGGTAAGCFDRIGWDALKVLTARLGSRLGRIETAAQWVYRLGGRRVLPLPRKQRNLKAQRNFKARRRAAPKARQRIRKPRK